MSFFGTSTGELLAMIRSTPVHYQVGDPPGSIGMGSVDSYSCFCACERCMTGSCCRFQTAGYVPPQPSTFTTTSTSLPLYPMCGGLQRDHEYAPFDKKRLFCRHCGETKEV